MLKAIELEAYVNEVVGVSEYYAVTQDRITQFGELTDDLQWIHVRLDGTPDVPRTRTIAHGFFLLSLFTTFVSHTVKVQNFSKAINFGLNYVRFITPVPVDSEVRGRVRLRGVVASNGFCQVTYEMSVECRGLVLPVCASEWIVRYYD